MGNIQQKLQYRANIASITAGQVVSIPAATHGLNSGKGALIPNYVHCSPLKATINVATGDVLVQNDAQQTLTNVRVTVGYDHTLIGANDLPEGTATYAALTPVAPSTAALSSGLVGHIVATIEEENPAVAVANNGVVPFSALPATISGVVNTSGTLTLPAGTYVAHWDISITGGTAGDFETRLTVDPAGAAAIAVSTTTTAATNGDEVTLSGTGIFTLAASGDIALITGVAGGGAGTYETAGAAANEVIGALHLMKIA